MPPLKATRPIPSCEFRDTPLQIVLSGLKDAIMDLQGINNRSTKDRLLSADDLEEGGQIFNKFIRTDGANSGLSAEQQKPVEFFYPPLINSIAVEGNQISGITVEGRTTRTRRTTVTLNLTSAGSNPFDWTVFSPSSCVLSADLGSPGVSLNSDHLLFSTAGYYRVIFRSDSTVASARTLQISKGTTSAANVWSSGTILKVTNILQSGTGVLFDVLLQAAANDMLCLWSTSTGSIDFTEIDLSIEHYLL